MSDADDRATRETKTSPARRWGEGGDCSQGQLGQGQWPKGVSAAGGLCWQQPVHITPTPHLQAPCPPALVRQVQSCRTQSLAPWCTAHGGLHHVVPEATRAHSRPAPHPKDSTRHAGRYTHTMLHTWGLTQCGEREARWTDVSRSPVWFAQRLCKANPEQPSTLLSPQPGSDSSPLSSGSPAWVPSVPRSALGLFRARAPSCCVGTVCLLCFPRLTQDP